MVRIQARAFAEPLMWRPGLTQIRVHELASELNVSTQQVMSLLADLGKKVRGPSTVVGASDAAKVRGRSRLPKSADPVEPASESPPTGPAGGSRSPQTAAVISQSLFLPPVAPPAQPVVAPSTAAFANPFAVPASTATPIAAAIPAQATPPQSAPRAAVPVNPRAVVNGVAPGLSEPVAVQVDHDATWDLQGISKADREAWCAAGMRPTEAELAGRCQSVGIAPSELSMKLSGRTSLQRLRDGEASTSVWARIREAEQQPGKAGTKLTGRFQLS
jgi:hypothetical protein